MGLHNAPGGVADSAPGALPPGPRQGLLAPGPPPRGDGPPWNRPPRWRVGEATALSGAAAVGAAVWALAGMRWSAITRRMGWLTRRRGAVPGPPPRGWPPLLEPPSSLALWWEPAKGSLKKEPPSLLQERYFCSPVPRAIMCVRGGRSPEAKDQNCGNPIGRVSAAHRRCDELCGLWPEKCPG